MKKLIPPDLELATVEQIISEFENRPNLQFIFWQPRQEVETADGKIVADHIVCSDKLDAKTIYRAAVSLREIAYGKGYKND